MGFDGRLEVGDDTVEHHGVQRRVLDGELPVRQPARHHVGEGIVGSDDRLHAGTESLEPLDEQVLDDAISGGGAGLRFLALHDIVPLEGGLPLVLGDPEGHLVLSTYLFKLTNKLGTPSYHLMAAVAVCIVGVTFPLVLLQRWLLKTAGKYVSVKGKATRQKLLPLRGWKWVALALVAALYHCLNHAQFKSLLFLATGSVLHATGQDFHKGVGALGFALGPDPGAAQRLQSEAYSCEPPAKMKHHLLT